MDPHLRSGIVRLASRQRVVGFAVMVMARYVLWGWDHLWYFNSNTNQAGRSESVSRNKWIMLNRRTKILQKRQYHSAALKREADHKVCISLVQNNKNRLCILVWCAVRCHEHRLGPCLIISWATPKTTVLLGVCMWCSSPNRSPTKTDPH